MGHPPVKKNQMQHPRGTNLKINLGSMTEPSVNMFLTRGVGGEQNGKFFPVFQAEKTTFHAVEIEGT